MSKLVTFCALAASGKSLAEIGNRKARRSRAAERSKIDLFQGLIWGFGGLPDAICGVGLPFNLVSRHIGGVQNRLPCITAGLNLESPMLIQTEFQGPGFVAVPNHVLNAGLTADALGVLVWLAARPAGSVVTVGAVMRVFSGDFKQGEGKADVSLKMGRDRWQRIYRELEAHGAFSFQPVQCPHSGRMIGRSVVVRWPEPGARKVRNAKGGKPGVRSDAAVKKVVHREPAQPVVGAVEPTTGSAGRRGGSAGSPRPAQPVPILKSNTGDAAAAPQAGGGVAGQSASESPEPVALSPSEKLRRASAAASMGLRFVDVVSGDWVQPGSRQWAGAVAALRSAIAENERGLCSEVDF